MPRLMFSKVNCNCTKFPHLGDVTVSSRDDTEPVSQYLQNLDLNSESNSEDDVSESEEQELSSEDNVPVKSKLKHPPWATPLAYEFLEELKDNVPVKSKLKHPPWATPLAFEFLENFCYIFLLLLNLLYISTSIKSTQ